MSTSAHRLTGLPGWRPGEQSGWGWLFVYGLTFLSGHWLSQAWGGSNYYSLWYLPAGLRFAFLWVIGAQWAVPCAVVELLSDLATGAVRGQTLETEWAWAVYAVLAPPLAYGASIAAVHSRTSPSLSAPMRFCLATVAAPVAAVAALAPQAMRRPDLIGIVGTDQLVAALTTMGLGDFLGILTLAPPLIAAASLASRGRRDGLRSISAVQLAEIVAVLLAASALVGILWRGGLSLQTTPLLMAVVWIGLRYGRVIAWCTLMLVNAAILPLTTMPFSASARIEWHLGLAAVMMAGYLAGSHADADAEAKAELARRNRLLLQSERLRTLRAMSVAIIHEISQPLTALTLEAGYLRRLSRAMESEITLSAQRIAAQAQGVATLVRRLRRFGERTDEAPERVAVNHLLNLAADLTGPEFKVGDVRLRVTECAEELTVLGHEVELAQALVNLLRNALADAADVTVELAARACDNRVVISVCNPLRAVASPRPGMGVGLIVVRTIVEAYGGHLACREERGQWTASISLPLATGKGP